MNVKNVSRVMGVVWIATSVLWAGMGIAGFVYGSNWLNGIQTSLDDNLMLVETSLDSIYNLIDETTNTISSTHQSLAATQISVRDASVALADLRPLLWKTTKVVTLDVPDALDGLQSSMPSLIETAKSVDETLTWLSNLKITIPIPFGPDKSYDLGIDYYPEVPLDQALEDMNNNLDEIPDDLRDLDESLSVTDANLVILSDDLAYLAGDIDTMNQQVSEMVPKMENLAENVVDIQTRIQETQSNLPETIVKVRKVFIVILGLLVFTQIPSLYMGGLLVSGALFPAHSPADEKE